MSADQLDSGRDSGRASGVPTPARKEKKRVGWHTSQSSGGGSSGGGGGSGGQRTDALDLSTLSPTASPRPRAGALSPCGPDALELSRKLTKVLSDESLDAMATDQPSPQFQTQLNLEPASPGGLGIRPPRPALRRNTSYDAPHDQEAADQAEQRADMRTLRSINDARSRADKLALSLGSHSAPGSRRNSEDLGASFHSLLSDSDDPHRGRPPRPSVIVNDYDDEEEGQAIRSKPARESPPKLRPILAAGPTAAAVGGGGGSRGQAGVSADDVHLRRRAPHRVSPDEYESLDAATLDEREVAERIVRSHTRRAGRDFFSPRFPRSQSGTSTPVSQQDYVQDYVPRPSNYRGGVLSSLLKLYHHDRSAGAGGGGHGSTGNTTPATNPSTPVVSPRPSPPTSRPVSRSGNPRSKRSSGLFSLHRSHQSSSSVTLAELMKSSSMFAAPGSSELSDRMAEQIRRENTAQSQPPQKSKKDHARITVHIAGILARHRYLLKLCRALMMYGAPTHRLEEYMMMSSRVLEIEGQFLYIPSCMIISFDDSTTHTTEVKIVRVPQGVDLGRLRDVHIIYKDVVHDLMGVEEATKRLDDVMNRPPKFPVWFRVLLYGVASVCVAPFAFKGRFIDLPIAFILGCIVGLLQLVLAPSNELYAHVFEVSASVVTSFIARGFGSINGGKMFCFSALAQSSIALILPGYMVLCSSLELQSHNLVAGSVRMVHAMIYTLFLGYGITIGASLYGMLDSSATSETTCADPLAREWSLFFVPGFTLCLCIVNQAQWKQTPVMVAMSLAGFCVNSYTSDYFKNNQISNMLGALTVGILANLYSRLGGHIQNGWLDMVEWWQCKVLARFSRDRRQRMSRKASEDWGFPSDPESRPVSPIGDDDEKQQKKKRPVGYSLAAAAMLPAIFVQVPSGLAAGGSLLAGVTSADEITNGTKNDAPPIGNLDGTAFNVLFAVIQVAISISVGLFMSVLIVYPLGKRRSGLFSF